MDAPKLKPRKLSARVVVATIGWRMFLAGAIRKAFGRNDDQARAEMFVGRQLMRAVTDPASESHSVDVHARSQFAPTVEDAARIDAAMRAAKRSGRVIG